MSGICGIVHFDGRPFGSAHSEILRRMAETASYRGPDGIRIWSGGSAGFAHLCHNLSGGPPEDRQPLVDAETGFVVCADARIDNRTDLCDRLRSERLLQSEPPTDGEFIMGAYRLWGEDCPAQLIGDFAFAVWDGWNRRLLLARDPMAMRGLCYCWTGETLVFATEVKQILAMPEVPRRLFEPAVGAYLAGPYALPEWTMFDGILQLAPAHALSVRPGNRRLFRFWDIDPAHQIRYRRDAEYGERFLEVFKESVRCRLPASRKTGILLSGGVDSGAVASMAGWLRQNAGDQGVAKVHTFSWAFRELPSCDERGVSSQIVNRYGLEHTDVEADHLWPLKDYPDYGPDLDDPYIDIYQPLKETTLSIARDQGVSTVITAERGDEMVGAWVYDFPGLLAAGRWRELWLELAEHRKHLGGSTPGLIKSYLLKPWLRSHCTPAQLRRLKRLRSRVSGNPPEPPGWYPPWLDPVAARRAGVEATVGHSRPWAPLVDAARRERYGLLFWANSARRIRLEERTCARFGLGYCDPWSDVRLARFVLAIPQWRVHSLRHYKRLARTALRGIMPESVVRERGKTEPVALYERGIRDESRQTIQDLITGTRAGALGYLYEAGLQAHYASVLQGEAQSFDILWPLTLEMWLRAHW